METAQTPAEGEEELREKPRKRERRRAVPLMPEVRFWNGTTVEIREKSDTNEVIISGTPIVYNTDYQVHDMFGAFTERMAPGVASEVLERDADVRFLFNHDGLPLARTKSGTMTLEDTPTALRMSVTLDARQQLANDLMIAIERGDVAEMSCGFVVARDEWDEDMEDRTVVQFADLLDVSAVTFPASPTTAIQVAKRMALEIPVESRARARKIYADLRAGRPLSEGNEERVVAAATALHSLLDSAGFEPEDEETTEAEVREETVEEAIPVRKSVRTLDFQIASRRRKLKRAA